MSDEIGAAAIHAAVAATKWGYSGISFPGTYQIPGLGSVETVEAYDGEAGEEDWSGIRYFIFNAPGSDKLWRKDGRYRSHDGTEWDEWDYPYPVIPQVRSKTYWIPVANEGDTDG